MRPEPEAAERSAASGACVLVLLAGVVAGVAFAVDEAVGVLTVVLAGVVALWRAVSRKGTDLALPSPTEAPSRENVFAVETGRAARVVKRPEGFTTVYPEIDYVADPGSAEADRPELQEGQ